MIEFRVVEFCGTLPDKLMRWTIQYRQDGGKWESMNVVTVNDPEICWALHGAPQQAVNEAAEKVP
jgi:hypothetical protein